MALDCGLCSIYLGSLGMSYWRDTSTSVIDMPVLRDKASVSIFSLFLPGDGCMISFYPFSLHSFSYINASCIMLTLSKLNPPRAVFFVYCG